MAAEPGLWSARLAAVGVGLALLRSMGVALRMNRTALPFTVATGVLEVAGTGLFLVAAYSGNLSIVAPAASLYPVSTVVLALIVGKERLRPVQVMGLGAAGVALLLASLP